LNGQARAAEGQSVAGMALRGRNVHNTPTSM
jgi:hypothetical protein